MRNKGFKTILMNPCKHKNTVSAVACTYGTHSVAVHIRKRFGVVCCCEIIAHRLPAPVFGNISIPFYAPSRHTPPVGSYNNVAVGSHQRKIPAYRKELRQCTLGTALTVQQRRIFFIRIKIRRIVKPYAHFFSVCSLYHFQFRFPESQLFISCFVDLGNWLQFPVLQVHSIQISVMINISA